MQDNSTDYSEKRDFVRVKIEIPHEIICIGKFGTKAGLCRDLSAGGLQIELQEPLQIEDTLEVHIVSSYSHTPELRAHTKIVRVTPSENGYTVGLKITEVLSG